MAARHCGIRVAIGWSAGISDRHERGERIPSPMPGNLPHNGMRTANNIHKYSDEAKWGCPGEAWGAIAVRGACARKNKDAIAALVCCLGPLQGSQMQRSLFCTHLSGFLSTPQSCWEVKSSRLIGARIFFSFRVSSRSQRSRLLFPKAFPQKLFFCREKKTPLTKAVKGKIYNGVKKFIMLIAYNNRLFLMTWIRKWC